MIETIKQKRFELGLYLILAIGIFFRFYQFDRQSLWGDELYSVYASTLPWKEMFLYLENDPHPPLFQVFLKIWILALPIQTEISIKLFPILISVFNLILIYSLTKAWEKWKRFFFLLFFSLSPGAIFYAQEIRSYSTLLLLSSVILVLIVDLLNSKPNSKKVFILILLSVISSYVHLFGFLICGSLYLVLFLKLSFEKNEKYKPIFLIGFFTFLLFIPFLVLMFKGTRISTAGWIEPPGLILFQTYYSLFFYTSKKFFYLTVIIPLAYFVYVLVKTFVFSKSESQTDNSKTILLSAFFLISTTTFLSLFIPIVTNRNWIGTLPLIYFFMACFLAQRKNKIYVINSLIILICLSFVDFKGIFYKKFKEDWRGTAQYVSNHCSGPTLLTDSYPEFLALYLKWNGNDSINPLLTKSNMNITQNKFCLVKRFLGGDGDVFSPSQSFHIKNKQTFYGFIVEEFEEKIP